MTSEEWAYLAGFFDGEGSIGIYEDSHERFGLSININQKGLPTLHWIESRLGGSISPVTNTALGYSGHRWSPKSCDRQSMLEGILPYSVLKTRQIEAGLAFLETTQDNRHLELVGDFPNQRWRISATARLIQERLRILLIAEKDQHRSTRRSAEELNV